MVILIDKFKEVDPDKECFLGHQFEKDGTRAVDKRCDYCGKWFCFDVTKIDDWGTNIKRGFNGVLEKVHCGSEHCQDYHYRVIRHQQKMEKELEERSFSLYSSLKSQGVL